MPPSLSQQLTLGQNVEATSSNSQKIEQAFDDFFRSQQYDFIKDDMNFKEAVQAYNENLQYIKEDFLKEKGDIIGEIIKEGDTFQLQILPTAYPLSTKIETKLQAIEQKIGIDTIRKPNDIVDMCIDLAIGDIIGDLTSPQGLQLTPEALYGKVLSLLQKREQNTQNDHIKTLIKSVRKNIFDNPRMGPKIMDLAMSQSIGTPLTISDPKTILIDLGQHMVDATLGILTDLHDTYDASSLRTMIDNIFRMKRCHKIKGIENIQNFKEDLVLIISDILPSLQTLSGGTDKANQKGSDLIKTLSSHLKKLIQPDLSSTQRKDIIQQIHQDIIGTCARIAQKDTSFTLGSKLLSFPCIEKILDKKAGNNVLIKEIYTMCKDESFAPEKKAKLTASLLQFIDMLFDQDNQDKDPQNIKKLQQHYITLIYNAYEMVFKDTDTEKLSDHMAKMLLFFLSSNPKHQTTHQTNTDQTTNQHTSIPPSSPKKPPITSFKDIWNQEDQHQHKSQQQKETGDKESQQYGIFDTEYWQQVRHDIAKEIDETTANIKEQREQVQEGGKRLEQASRLLFDINLLQKVHTLYGKIEAGTNHTQNPDSEIYTLTQQIGEILLKRQDIRTSLQNPQQLTAMITALGGDETLQESLQTLIQAKDDYVDTSAENLRKKDMNKLTVKPKNMFENIKRGTGPGSIIGKHFADHIQKTLQKSYLERGKLTDDMILEQARTSLTTQRHNNTDNIQQHITEKIAQKFPGGSTEAQKEQIQHMISSLLETKHLKDTLLHVGTSLLSGLSQQYETEIGETKIGDPSDILDNIFAHKKEFLIHSLAPNMKEAQTLLYQGIDLIYDDTILNQNSITLLFSHPKLQKISSILSPKDMKDMQALFTAFKQHITKKGLKNIIATQTEKTEKMPWQYDTGELLDMIHTILTNDETINTKGLLDEIMKLPLRAKLSQHIQPKRKAKQLATSPQAGDIPNPQTSPGQKLSYQARPAQAKQETMTETMTNTEEEKRTEYIGKTLDILEASKNNISPESFQKIMETIGQEKIAPLARSLYQHLDITACKKILSPDNIQTLTHIPHRIQQGSLDSSSINLMIHIAKTLSKDLPEQEVKATLTTLIPLPKKGPGDMSALPGYLGDIILSQVHDERGNNEEGKKSILTSEKNLATINTLLTHIHNKAPGQTLKDVLLTLEDDDMQGCVTLIEEIITNLSDDKVSSYTENNNPLFSKETLVLLKSLIAPTENETPKTGNNVGKNTGNNRENTETDHLTSYQNLREVFGLYKDLKKGISDGVFFENGREEGIKALSHQCGVLFDTFCHIVSPPTEHKKALMKTLMQPPKIRSTDTEKQARKKEIIGNIAKSFIRPLLSRHLGFTIQHTKKLIEFQKTKNTDILYDVLTDFFTNPKNKKRFVKTVIAGFHNYEKRV